MKNINILLNLLIIAYSIATLNLQSAARSSTTETKTVERIDSDEIIKALIYCKKDVAIKLIQSNRINLNFKDKSDRTALHWATYKDFFEVVQLLLERDVDINYININGFTALMSALVNEHIEIAGLLIEKGADVNIQTKEGRTALIIATEDGHIDIVKSLLKHGAHVNTKDNGSQTALIIASRVNQLEIAKLLIEHGADINAKGEYGWTPLLTACQWGHAEIVTLLLEYDVDLNATNKLGESALSLATGREYTDIVNLIKDKQILNEYSENIFKAYEQKDIETCKFYLNKLNNNLFTNKKFLMLQNKEKNCLLHEAVIKRDYGFIDYILNYNPEIVSDLLNMTNKNGMTPIDLAATDEYLLNYFMNFAYPSITERVNY